MARKQNNVNALTIMAVIAVIAVVAVVAYSIGQNSYQQNYSYGMMNKQYASGMMDGGMMDSGMMSGGNAMMSGGMMQGMMNGGTHDSDDIEFMQNMMKNHMNISDAEFAEMSEHCPMMSGA